MSAEVHIVRLEEADGLYVFADPDDADRFRAACEAQGRCVCATSEPVFDTGGTTRLIETL